MSARLRDLPDEERARLSAGFVLKLRALVEDHMTSHAVAANSPSRGERRAAKKASRAEFSDLLDALKALGLSEREARVTALAAYESASRTNPPISDADSLSVVAGSASTAILNGLHAGGYLNLEEAFGYMEAQSPDNARRAIDGRRQALATAREKRAQRDRRLPG